MTTQTEEYTSSQKLGTLIAAIMASGIVFLDSTVTNVALPKIDVELKAGLSGLQWIVNGYFLSLTALLILGGALGDIFGRKKVMMYGLAAFAVASLGCGIAPNTELLVFSRILQGAAGAFVVPGSLAILRFVYLDPAERGKAIGSWSAWGGVTTLLGPFLGGFLVDNLSWRWVFIINPPIIIATLFLFYRYVPESTDKNRSHELDWLGAVLVAAGMGALTYGLVEGPVQGWLSLASILGIGLGLILLVVFVIVEINAKNPMVPLSLFKSRNFTVINLATLLIYFALYGMSFFITIYVQSIMGISALISGVAFLPLSILLFFLSPITGRLAGQYGAKRFIGGGAVIYSLGFIALLLLQPDSNIFLSLIPVTILMGVGLSMVVAPLTATVMSSVPTENSGTGSAVNNMVSRVAALIGVSLLGIVLSASILGALPERGKGLSPEQYAILQKESQDAGGGETATLASQPQVASAYKAAYTDAFHNTMIACAILAFAGGAVAYFFLTDNPKDNPA